MSQVAPTNVPRPNPPFAPEGSLLAAVLACSTALAGATLWEGGPASGPSSRLAARLDPAEATAAEWSLLPGIGPALADRIVAARREGVDVRSREGLDSVRGIGPATMERLAHHVAGLEAASAGPPWTP